MCHKEIDGRTPIIRKLVIRTANYPDRLGPSGKFVENCTYVKYQLALKLPVIGSSAVLCYGFYKTVLGCIRQVSNSYFVTVILLQLFMAKNFPPVVKYI